VSEFTQAARIWSGNLGLHVDCWPSGKFGFVGSIPVELAYIYKDGSFPISEQDAKDIRQFGPGLVMKSRGIQVRSWESRDAAIAEATRLGHKVIS
jgi:hypothetical protein